MDTVDCIFCAIAARQAPASVVFEDDVCLAFMDLYPMVPGHLLVVPKTHAANLSELDEATGMHLFRIAQRMAAAFAVPACAAKASTSSSPTAKRPARMSSTFICTWSRASKATPSSSTPPSAIPPAPNSTPTPLQIALPLSQARHQHFLIHASPFITPTILIMPKRTDIHTILIPGSGPIVIGQAAEFDYSGTQALKVLREQGYRVILVNSNPATIMTDPDLADVTYIEPTTPEVLEAIIAQERPDAMLPTVGGQTGLNLALALSENGVLERYGVTLLGASLESIRAAEDRLVFRETMLRAGLPIPAGGPATSLAEAEAVAQEAGYPLLVRASFALGGSGASWVYRPEELAEAVRKAIAESPIGQAWIEQSIMGWKEYELEVIRDRADNFVVVCSIENLDPMGVHTGDSITVAPAQTLTDPEYQVLRDLARKVMTAVGVETGGSNVQFAVDPRTGRTVIIEMNPRSHARRPWPPKPPAFPSPRSPRWWRSATPSTRSSTTSHA